MQSAFLSRDLAPVAGTAEATAGELRGSAYLVSPKQKSPRMTMHAISAIIVLFRMAPRKGKKC